MKTLLTAAILAYRLNPWRKHCPNNPSCSELGLAAARKGLGLAGVRAVIASCPARAAVTDNCGFPCPGDPAIGLWEGKNYPDCC